MKKPFSLYIHIPFCISKCSYCDFFSIKCGISNLTTSRIPDSYITSLINELKFRIKNYKSKECKSVYIGGGTPSLLTQNQFTSIFDFIKNELELTKDYEFTVELNPDDVTEELLQFLNASIINRISLGIQSLDDSVLKFVKRRAGKKENLNAINLIEKFWKKEVSYDLISALPLEKEKSFLENLDFICSKKPAHISLYSLTVEEETELGKEIFSSHLDYDFEKADSMWLKGKKLLEKRGYHQYEISNFCLKGKECRHNLTYWNHQDYIGAGSGGTGTVYNQDGSGIRWTNIKDIEKYIKAWEKYNPSTSIADSDCQITEKIERDTSKFEFFMMGLRKNAGISDTEYKSVFNEEIPLSVVNLFKKWQKKKLSEIETQGEDTRYYLNSKGLLFLNQFLEQMEL